MNINYKINIDKPENKFYNTISRSDIKIFTYEDYLKYQNYIKEKYGENYLCDNDAEYQTTDVNNPHDKICRKALNKKRDAVKIINRILKDGEEITEKEIEKYNSSFISDELRNSESDVVYKLKNENVFFIIEHQTRIDYSMPYRMQKYIISVIDSVVIDKTYISKEYVFPLVIPIVLYTGNQKWNANLDFSNIQYKWIKYDGPTLTNYNVLDVNNISNEELLEESSMISKIMLLEKSRTEEELYENLNKIYDEVNQNEDKYTKEDKELLIKETEIVAKNLVGEEKTKEILKEFRIGGSGNMLAVLDMLEREKKEREIKFKKLEKLEKVQEENREYIKNMLKEKLPIELISKITGKNKEEIEKIKYE